MTRYNKKFFNISKENEMTILIYSKYRRGTLKKSEMTVRQNIQILRSLANFLKGKSFIDATEDDLKEFFAAPFVMSSLNTRDIYGTNLIMFYRWLLKLKKHERPAILDWFEYTTSSQRVRMRDPNQKEKYYITREEYEKIIENCITVNGHDQALFETLYLSGGRPHEIAHMCIKDVEEEVGNIIIVFSRSKTRPRKVPLSEPADNLMRWLANHPFKDNLEASLWLTFSRQSRYKPMQTYSIAPKLEDIKKRANLKKTITPQTFRKTRATIMFGKAFDDTEMSQLFGWSPQTVVKRRQEYDLRGFDDLKVKIFAKSGKVKSYDTVVKERDNLINELRTEIDSLRKQLAIIFKAMNQPYDFKEGAPGPHGTWNYNVQQNSKSD